MPWFQRRRRKQRQQDNHENGDKAATSSDYNKSSVSFSFWLLLLAIIVSFLLGFGLGLSGVNQNGQISFSSNAPQYQTEPGAAGTQRASASSNETDRRIGSSRIKSKENQGIAASIQTMNSSSSSSSRVRKDQGVTPTSGTDTTPFPKKNQTSSAKNNNSNNTESSSSPPTQTSHSSNSSQGNNSTNAYQNFTRYPGVAIVTKFQGPNQHFILDQGLCLLQQAYNKYVNYDIIVFHTDPVEEKDKQITRQLVHPAKLTFVMDNRGSLPDEIRALTPQRRDNFMRRCNFTHIPIDNLTWWDYCPDGRLAYNWQAEFRSWHLWHHPALQSYQYMMWVDSDNFCTQRWPSDPMKLFMDNKLHILFDHFPQGSHGGAEVHKRIFDAFGVDLCHLRLHQGRLFSKLKQDATCDGSPIPNIHGFFHITDLDFYRRVNAPSPNAGKSSKSNSFQYFRNPKTNEPIRWGHHWIGENYLQRRFDDQLAVTVPPAILTPNKAWDLRSNGIRLNIFHNCALDGVDKGTGGFRHYFRTKVKPQFPEATVCPIRAGA